MNYEKLKKKVKHLKKKSYAVKINEIITGHVFVYFLQLMIFLAYNQLMPKLQILLDTCNVINGV